MIHEKIKLFYFFSLQVIEGLDIVRTIEAQGSRSGATKAKIVIEDSGELPLTGDLRD